MKIHLGNLVTFALGAAMFCMASIRPSQAASWMTNGPMNVARYFHAATLLSNGKVLVSGGYDYSATSLASTELFDPATGSWAATGDLNDSRSDHAATALANGQILVTGGNDFYLGIDYGTLASAEIFNPATGKWTKTAPMANSRASHTATLLLDGRVLVAGGYEDNDGISSAELYDPATGMWQATGSLKTARSAHTATVLPDGRVLIAGGMDSNAIPLATTELYSPDTGSWTNAGLLNHARYGHTATLLPNGLVLVAGGSGDSNLLSSAELFDPTTGTWTETITTPTTARIGHRATLLPDGKVLLAGGYAVGFYVGALASVEVYDPATGLWTTNNPLAYALGDHSATLLANGKVLVTGGYSDVGGNFLNSSEVYDPAINPATGTWTNTGAMSIARYLHTATLLTNGQVLVVGGKGGPTASTEIYYPATGTWTNAGMLNAARSAHTATLLPNGLVLVAGGDGPFANALSSAELYNPATKTWTNTGSMHTARDTHTATLLRNGKVLVAGGDGQSGTLASAEIYDPATGIWTVTGSLKISRWQHTATLLPNGQVLIAGGTSTTGGSYLSRAELYDPVAGTWTTNSSMITGRMYHRAILLSNGRVLVAGGTGFTGYLSSAELYDPTTGTWTATGSMTTTRQDDTMTLLQNGKVLVAGGPVLSTAELYDPATGIWTATGSMTTARTWQTATLLLNGKVLIAGGSYALPMSSAELFDVGLACSNVWQPQITAATSPLNLGGSLVVTGAQFRGVTEGSSGNTQDSTTDYPLVQLRSIESGQTTFLLTTNWSTNSVTSSAVWNFPPGWALATVFVNGIQSTSAIVNISVPVPTTTTLNSPTVLTNRQFQFAFTNNPGALFGVLSATNMALPLANWMALGGVVEVAPGQFQFTDPQATNGDQRYYRLYAP